MSEKKIITWWDAVESLGKLPNNRIMWFKLNPTFTKFWSGLDRKLSCADCSLDVLATALLDIVAPNDDLKQCAEFMVASLNHAASENPEQCQMPGFAAADIIGRRGEMKQEKYLKSLSPAPSDVSDGRTMNHESVTMNQNVKSTKPIKVVKIDPQTLKPCGVFDSLSLAQRASGTSNIDRAIKNHSIAGGYFWCQKGDEKHFQPKEKKMGRPSKRPTHSPSGEEGKANSQRSLSDLSDDELIAELQHRGYTGTINIVITKTIEL